MSSSKFLYCFNEHRGAVKALAWCPYQSDVLASGGGINCGCIKIWSTQKGSCINSIGTKSQVSNRKIPDPCVGHDSMRIPISRFSSPAYSNVVLCCDSRYVDSSGTGITRRY